MSELSDLGKAEKVTIGLKPDKYGFWSITVFNESGQSGMRTDKNEYISTLQRLFAPLIQKRTVTSIPRGCVEAFVDDFFFDDLHDEIPDPLQFVIDWLTGNGVEVAEYV